MRSKIIAVWGYKGKTTCTVNLAWQMTQEKPDKVITLLSSNLLFGDIQGYFGEAVWEQHGLNAALKSNEHARNFLWRAGTERPLCDIFMLTLANDTDALMQDYPSEESCEHLIEQLSDEQTDYLFIDCSCDLQNPISSVGIVMADRLLCLHTPSNAAYQWFRSMRSFREQLDLEMKTIHLLYATDYSANPSQYISSLGVKFADTVPWIRSAKEHENRGVPICAENHRDNRAYKQALQRICGLL